MILLIYVRGIYINYHFQSRRTNVSMYVYSIQNIFFSSLIWKAW
jgi:hypothetical protein